MSVPYMDGALIRAHAAALQRPGYDYYFDLQFSVSQKPLGDCLWIIIKLKIFSLLGTREGPSIWCPLSLWAVPARSWESLSCSE